MSRIIWLCLILVMSLSACRGRGQTPDDIATRIPSIEVLATTDYLTAIAPPEGMRALVSFPTIDENLVFVSNWRAEASFRFDGVFARTPRAISAETTMTVWYNRLGNRRRVQLQGGGELFGDEETPNREAVRIGGNTFLIIDGLCLGDARGDAATLADLPIGEVIGGVDAATPAGEKRVLHGQDVWRYAFAPEDVVLPLVDLGEDGSITDIQGELWVTQVEDTQAVPVRYYANLEVDNVRLRLFDTSLPLTGTLQIRYDLYDIGVDPNITTPNGC